MPALPFSAVLKLLTVTVLLLVAPSVSIAAEEPPLAGGYAQAVVNAEITDVAKAATRMQAEKEQKTLRLIKVIKAEQQVVAGLNYRLALEVQSGKGSVRQAIAVVYRNLKGELSLTSWDWAKK